VGQSAVVAFLIDANEKWNSAECTFEVKTVKVKALL
jgi:hypothetical protein